MSKKKPVGVDGLIERKRALALKAAQGDEKARAEWEAVAHEISEHEQEALLAEDARLEQERITREAEAAQLAAEQREKERILADCQADYKTALQKVQDTVGLLIEPVEEALQAATLVASAAADASKHIERVKGKVDIARYIREKLACLWPEFGDWVRPIERGPLVASDAQTDDDDSEPFIELLPDPCPATGPIDERTEVAN